MPSHPRCSILSRKHSAPRRSEASRRLLMASEGAGAVGPQLGEMDLDEFRRAGHRIVDWIADYRAHPECYPVLSRCRLGEVRAQLPRAAPSEAESIECILNDFERLIQPGITHWNLPRSSPISPSRARARGLSANFS